MPFEHGFELGFEIGFSVASSMTSVRREYPLTPLLGVGAICFDDQDRVLLVRRGTEPLKGRWSIPGGLVEVGETLVDAVKREIHEETGIFVQPEAIVEVVERIYCGGESRSDPGNASGSDSDETRVRFHYVIVDFWCKVSGGTMLAASDAAEVCWATREEWKETDRYSLEPMAVQVIEKGWQMAQAANRDE